MQRRQTGACVCPAAERARGTAPACTVRVGTHSQLTGKTTKLNMHVHARRSVSCLSRASCFHSLRPTEASGHFPPNTRKRKLVLGLKLVRLSEFRVFLRRFLGSSCTLLEQIPTGFCAVFNGSRRCTDAAGGGARLVGGGCDWEPLLFSVGDRSSTVVRLCCGRSAHFDCVSLRLGAKRERTVSSSPLAELILLWVLQKHGAETRGGPLRPPARSARFPHHHTLPSAKTLL